MTQAHARIELWLIDLARCAPALEALERETPRLADDDRERAGAIRDGIERRERLSAYIALRVVLERAAGTGIRRRPFVRGQGGTPRLAEGGPRFSLSHTDGFALIGLAATLPIGVDVERTRPLKMAPHRREKIGAAGIGLAGKCLPEEVDRAAVQAWVRLEAFTKARGRALADTLADLGLRRRGPPPAHLGTAAQQLARQAGLTVADVSLPLGLQGAVAVAAGACLPHPRRFPADREGIEQLLVQPWPGVRPGP